jgi:hypothetical protein
MQTVNEIAKRYANKCPHGVWRDDAELAFLDGVKFAQRWIPVEDELPEERVFVLCQNPFSVFVASFHGKEKGFRIPNAEGEYKVTHWRPIEYPIL